MKRFLALGIILAGTGTAAAADDPAATACEIAVEAVITTPATYARVGVELERNFVHITFDSKNAAGSLVRDRADCTFESRNGAFRLTGVFVNGRNYTAEILPPVAMEQWQSAGVSEIDPKITGLSMP